MNVRRAAASLIPFMWTSVEDVAFEMRPRVDEPRCFYNARGTLRRLSILHRKTIQLTAPVRGRRRWRRRLPLIRIIIPSPVLIHSDNLDDMYVWLCCTCDGQEAPSHSHAPRCGSRARETWPMRFRQTFANNFFLST